MNRSIIRAVLVGFGAMLFTGGVSMAWFNCLDKDQENAEALAEISVMTPEQQAVPACRALVQGHFDLKQQAWARVERDVLIACAGMGIMTGGIFLRPGVIRSARS